MRNSILFLLLTLAAGTTIGAQDPMLKCSRPLQQWVLGKKYTGEQHLFFVGVSSKEDFEKQTDLSVVQIVKSYTGGKLLLIKCEMQHFYQNVILLESVKFADPGVQTATEELIVPGHNLFVNNIRYIHSKRPELDGRGTVLSVKEFRYDTADVDFRNRNLSGDPQVLGSTVHATIMATLAGGAGNADPAGTGAAPGCRLYSSGFLGLTPDEDIDYQSNNITVQNHSYGSGIQDYYGALAALYDQTAIDHPELVHLFSAGNEGFALGTNGLFGFANLTGNYKMAKNILTVGAIDSFYNPLYFSSRGPAYDGRTKPDLVTFGNDGTSGATALVSGAAAVVRQAFYEKYGYYPKSDLVKAILIGSADDMGAPGPDFITGYGNLNLRKAVELVENQIMASDVSASDAIQTFYLDNLPANIKNLKITLHWNDIPATPDAPKALTNDLDLEVYSPDGTQYLPWVLSFAPFADSLAQPARNGVDTLNTTEQVVIQKPIPGTYEVKIKGSFVTTGIQPYAFVVQWDTINQFIWTSPVKGDPCASGQQVVLRWDNNFDTPSGKLEWQAPGSAGWQLIDPSISLSTGYYKWQAPQICSAAQVRMTIDGKLFNSDTFLISTTPRLRVDANCPDSMLLSWPAVAPGAHYRLWGLGQRYMEPLLQTTDTLLTLQKVQFPQERFAITVFDPITGAESPRSSAPPVNDDGTGCFINSLLALLNGNQEVDLTLYLGSLKGVQQIIIERKAGDQWQPIGQSGPDALILQFTDPLPFRGVNIYRAKLTMNNSGTITGEQVFVDVPGSAGVIFPNPAVGGHAYVLFDVGAETPQFRLYDLSGKLLQERTLEETRTDISDFRLPPGCYLWTVKRTSGQLLSQGKLVILQQE